MRRSLGLAVMAVALTSPVIATGQTTTPLEGEGFAARFGFMGQVQPRTAAEIKDNDWSVGTEAMDRDYSTYDAWKAYLGPLGATRARLQSGWSRTDLGGGRYDFAWLDPVIDGMRAQGVRPWLSLSYGNDRYQGGGISRRDGGLPTGAGRRAWLAYVTATATRYRGKIVEYEVWNEPDLNVRIGADEYGQFAYETAKAIKAADPKANIILGAFAGAVWENNAAPREFARQALTTFVRLGGRGLATAVTYHAYHPNPDAVYPSLPSFQKLVHDIDPGIEVRQGENGAPSINQQHYAMRNLWWTEQSQAKWALRRLIGDAGHGVPSSIFTLTEMHYPVEAETNLAFHGHSTVEKPASASAKHMKGMLETRLYAPNTPQDDRTVVRPKMAYASVQAVTAIFDRTLKLVDPATYRCTITGPKSTPSLYAFRRADGATLIALWRSTDMPDVNTLREAADVRCTGLRFGTSPRYVDMLTRGVYETRGLVARDGAATVITALPIYDAPVLVADAPLVNAR